MLSHGQGVESSQAVIENVRSSMSTSPQHRSIRMMACQEHLARTIAATMGEASIAARALKELDCRRARGQAVTIYPTQGRWIVEAL